MENQYNTAQTIPLAEWYKADESLRTIFPGLSDNGKTWASFLQAEIASATPHFLPIQGSFGYPPSISSSARTLVSPTVDRSPSGMEFSETSSLAGSIHSPSVFENDTLVTTPLAPAPILHQRGTPGHRLSPPHRVAKRTNRNATPAALSPLPSPNRKVSLKCPFCAELEAPSSKSAASFSRKADLKRHFKAFHNTNAQFLCPERSCGMSFDWESAFKNHMKYGHGNTRCDLKSAMVKLCSQLVFACGFTSCRQIFEADDCDDVEEVATNYFNHVANHFEDNFSHHRWSYSVRFRNLTRQSDVVSYWKNMKKGAGTQDLKWQPHTSTVVRKMLETRHLSNVELVVDWALRLGSTKPWCDPLSPMPKQMPPSLCLPIEKHCNRRGPVVQLASLPSPSQPELATIGTENELCEPLLTTMTHDFQSPARTTSRGIQGHLSFQPAVESESFASALGNSFLSLDEQSQVASVIDPTFVSSQPLQSWLCEGTNPSSLFVQSQFNPATSYTRDNQFLSPELRPATPAQKMLRPETYRPSSPRLSAFGSADTDMNDADDADHELYVDY
ncbi:hypothetical protein B0H63DRAFT_519792 [Podospora didyma]|uniref:C2H2-type domain-containing protein n=1 Tax=Podospora didyma TaxID=330526 RepID=A0AAE0NZI1_9PEZI|nr:hypothetical protein B0H63DRAFT_519792 [Podospora didyma]